VAQPHRRGAGVVGLTGDAQRLPRDALHVVHGADQATLGVQHRALFDVQFDESLRLRQRQGRLAQVADALQFVGEHGWPSMARVAWASARLRPAGIDQRAQHVGLEARAFLVGEHRHHQRMARREAGPVERCTTVNAGQHAVVAVVAATGCHGVDVRTGHHRRQVLEPIAPAEDIAHRIDLHAQAELAHPAANQVASGAIGIGQCQAAAATVAGVADAAQCLQPLQAGRPDRCAGVR
jgi:hypothetical protein